MNEFEKFDARCRCDLFKQCVLDATQEDMLCDICRNEEHGHVSTIGSDTSWPYLYRDGEPNVVFGMGEDFLWKR